MKLCIFDYSSEGNIFSGEVCIEAKGLVEAQDKFIDWVKKQPDLSAYVETIFQSNGGETCRMTAK